MLNVNQMIADGLSIKARQVDATIQLLADENTVPFIARYRKEITGALDEDQIRVIEDRWNYFRKLEARKETILQTIEKQDKLTPELQKQILAITDAQELEDIYLPFKPKKRTRATIAKEKGLEPLAFLILAGDPKRSPEELAIDFISAEVPDEAEAIAGAGDILAEYFSDQAALRAYLRQNLSSSGLIVCHPKDKNNPENNDYEMYLDFAEGIDKIPSHRILAINRGEKEDILKVQADLDHEKMIGDFVNRSIYKGHPYAGLIKEIMTDAYKRLIFPAVEREIRNMLTDRAEKQAVDVFGMNLYQLLMQPPVRGHRIMGIDPGFRTGCKIAVIDKTGKYLTGETIYPVPPHNRVLEAEKITLRLIREHKVEIIAIGNGTASRETTEFIAALIEKEKLSVKFTVVNEAGASVYSASPVAKEEFPDLEASTRGNISIARRLQDPLAELVKIEPKSIGVGQYQHDVNQKMLAESLDQVIESAVNQVGVDVNTASTPLLERVSGLNKTIARNIKNYRDEHGALKQRIELMNVKGLGAKAFEQSAGFLKIYGSNNFLDATTVHPESYPAARKLFKELDLDFAPESAVDLKFMRDSGAINIIVLAERLGVGNFTLKDILDALIRPDRDPREDMPPVHFKEGVLKIEDLKEGMKVTGTIQNITDFGAFVDIGLKNAGLIHVSKLSRKFVKNIHEVIKVGQTVEATVISIDVSRGRIGLSLVD